MEVAESTLLFRAFRQQLGRFWLALRESEQPIWFDQGLKRHGREIVLSARMENNRNIYKVKANNTKVCQNRNRLWRLARLIPSAAQLYGICPSFCFAYSHRGAFPMQRRDFLKAAAMVPATLAASADVPSHLWQGYDFGGGPPVRERLNQGPFDVDQDQGWRT